MTTLPLGPPSGPGSTPEPSIDNVTFCIEHLGMKDQKVRGAFQAALGIATGADTPESRGDPRLRNVLDRIIKILYYLENSGSIPENDVRARVRDASDKLVEYCTLHTGAPAEDFKMDYRAQEELSSVEQLLQEILRHRFPGEKTLPEAMMRRFGARVAQVVWTRNPVKKGLEIAKRAYGTSAPIIRPVYNEGISPDREKIERILEDVMNARQGGYTKFNRRQFIAGAATGVAAVVGVPKIVGGVYNLFAGEETPADIFEQFTAEYVGGKKVKFQIPSGYKANRTFIVYMGEFGGSTAEPITLKSDGTYEVPKSGKWSFTFSYKSKSGEQLIGDWRHITVP